MDTSIAIRVLFGERHPSPTWGHWSMAYASRLWHIEALRVLDRTRLEAHCDTATAIQLRRNIDIINDCLISVPISEHILVRAGESFPTVVGALDAIHLVTAMHIRETDGLDTFLTHDRQLATAAAAMGFVVQGA